MNIYTLMTRSNHSHRYRRQMNEKMRLVFFKALRGYVGYIGELGHQSQKHLDTLVRDIFRI